MTEDPVLLLQLLGGKERLRCHFFLSRFTFAFDFSPFRDDMIAALGEGNDVNIDQSILESGQDFVAQRWQDIVKVAQRLLSFVVAVVGQIVTQVLGK